MMWIERHDLILVPEVDLFIHPVPEVPQPVGYSPYPYALLPVLIEAPDVVAGQSLLETEALKLVPVEPGDAIRSTQPNVTQMVDEETVYMVRRKTIMLVQGHHIFLAAAAPIAAAPYHQQQQFHYPAAHLDHQRDGLR
jgi:hypothetical protein